MIEKESKFIDTMETLLPSDSVGSSVRLIYARWVVGCMILLATAACVHLLKIDLPEYLLYCLGGCVLVYNAILLSVQHRYVGTHPHQFRRVVNTQILLDWFSIGVFLHLTGGATSPAIPFFFIHAVLVTILLPSQSPFSPALLAICVVVLVATLEAAEILGHYTVIPGLSDDLYLNWHYVLAQIFFFAVALLTTVSLTASMMARLRARERQVSALFFTTETVLSSLKLVDVLDRLTEKAAQALTIPAASIRLLDATGEQLKLVTAHGLSQSYLDKGQVELTQSELDREALSEGVAIIGDARSDRRVQYPKEIAAEGIGSILVVSIMGKRPLGVLRVYSSEANHFKQEDVNFLTAIAHQGAIAIENALTYDALQKAEEQRTQFVRIVTHELRAPVTGTQSLLRVLLNNLAGDLSDQQRDIIGRLNRRMDSLLVLINDLLSLAASRAVDLQQPLTPIGVQPVLKAAIDRIKIQAEEKSISLAVDMPQGWLEIAATGDGLRRIFDNLLSNAVKYTLDDGSVNIQVWEESPNVVVMITDTGIGIPKDSIDRLGEEFFRASNARQSGIIGTGLGLTASKQLIDYFQGSMRVESRVGRGTTIILEFPKSPHMHI
jgi:signal transduction histidine kinase